MENVIRFVVRIRLRILYTRVGGKKFVTFDICFSCEGKMVVFKFKSPYHFFFVYFILKMTS